MAHYTFKRLKDMDIFLFLTYRLHCSRIMSRYLKKLFNIICGPIIDIEFNLEDLF